MIDSKLRRAVDVSLAAGALVVAAVPLACSAAAIKIAEPGAPVLYPQTRVGRDGRPFRFLKLRTMRRVDGDGPQVTASGDARITGVGRVLRRLKLDELPQLFNVLRGDLTIIGPRPEVPRYVARYTDSQRRILAVTPGLASQAQFLFADEASLLAAQRNAEEYYVGAIMPLKIAADLDYEARRTAWTDLRLMLRLTLQVIGLTRRPPLPVTPDGLTGPSSHR